MVSMIDEILILLKRIFFHLKIMNTSIILVIKMIFTVDKPVLFPFNTVVDDPNPSI